MLKRLRWIGAIGSVALALGVPNAGAQGQRSRGELVVGVVVDGPSDAYRTLTADVRAEVEALAGPGSPRIRFDDELVREADFSRAGVTAAVDDLLADGRVGLLLAIGAVATEVIAPRESLPKPVILAEVYAPQRDRLPRAGTSSGRRNLAYVVGSLDFETDLERFRTIARFERLDIVLYGRSAQEIGGLEAYVRRVSRERRVELRVHNVESTPEAILAALPEGAQAVYLGPLIHLEDAQLRTLAVGLEERGIASFTPLGRELVSAGILATATSRDDRIRRARRVALLIQRVGRGEDPARFPVTFEQRERVVINYETARAIGIYPPWSLLIDAEVIGQRRSEVERNLNLDATLAEAVARNLDLRVANASVRVGQQDVDRARAPLLPSLQVDATGALIDVDRSNNLGTPGQWSANWGFTATQVLFSEGAWTQFRAEERLQDARKLDRDTIRLDIILEAAEAYLNVLRTLTAERVQRDNLRLTRENLALARVRVNVGTSGPADVYRWEAAIANSERDVISASATRNQAEIELNRVLLYPLEDPFLISETDLDDPFDMVAGYRPVFRYLDNPWSFRVFRQFMAEEAVRNSPELQALDAQIAAARRQIEGFGRVLWLPTFALQGTFTHNFFNEGGLNPQQPVEVPDGLPPELEQIFGSFGGGFDAFDFQVGLTASLPLYAGGERYANLRQARELVAQLEEQRASTAQRVEQRIRAAMHVAGASYAAVGLTRRAADATRRNLELVTRSYREGATTIITLIDAQNQALQAALAAETAVYDFLVDALRVERASGVFTAFEEPAVQADFNERLRSFAAERGVQAPPPVPGDDGDGPVPPDGAPPAPPARDTDGESGGER
ncbi:MAG: TolC family protein [Sandaracinaceae bacterium]